ncbi:TPA: Fe-S protein assembly co-chaperone HscB, partial [Pasteurella multocida]
MNPFNIFDLPVDFHVDQATLSARYLALQKSLHPDNFTTHSAQEQRLAMQRSAEVNDALQILKDPILRAETIIAIYTGEQQNIEENSTRDMAFLMQQMQW